MGRLTTATSWAPCRHWPPPSEMGIENGKSNSEKNSLAEVKIVARKTKPKQWRSSNQSLPPTSRQLPIQPWSPESLPTPQMLLLTMILYGMGHPSGQLGWALLALSSPSLSPSPSCSLRSRRGKKRQKCCASIAQQQPTHWGVSNTVWATDPKHTTIQAAVKKTSSIPARPSRQIQKLMPEIFATLLLKCLKLFHHIVPQCDLWGTAAFTAKGTYMETHHRSTSTVSKISGKAFSKDIHINKD